MHTKEGNGKKSVYIHNLWIIEKQVSFCMLRAAPLNIRAQRDYLCSLRQWSCSSNEQRMFCSQKWKALCAPVSTVCI